MPEPFVGREAELDALAGLARRVADEGRPGAALILGPAGQGKSRLLAEARARSRAPALSVVGYEPEREVPLAAAAGLLRELSRAPGEGDRLAALLAGELGAGGALESVRVFEAARAARSALGAALIAVDDLQWADDLTLALCHYLVRAAATAPEPLSLVAASRPSPRAERFAASLRGRLEGALGIVVIELEPLPAAKALELAHAVAPGLAPEEREAVVRRAAGSPFWIRALARSGGERDAARVVAARLEEVGGDARAVVAALAVAGRPLPRAGLQALMDWPGESTDAALDEAVAQGLAAEGGDGVALTHDLIRQGALAAVPAEARRQLHRRLAENIEREAGDDLTLLRAALAHRVTAGAPSADLALRIARAPRARLMGAEGVRELAAIASEPGDEPTALELRECVAQLADAVGDHELALSLWSALEDEVPDAAWRRRAALGAGWSALLLGRGPEARGFLRRIREADAAPHEALSADALEASVLIWLDNRVPEGAAIAARASGTAKATAEAAGGCELLDDRSRRACLQALGAAFDAALRLDDADAIAAIADLMVHASRGFDQEAHLDALRHGAVVAYELGRLEEAAPRLQRICDEARSRFLPAAEVRAAGYLARTLLPLGRLDEAEAALRRVERIPAAADLPGWRHIPRVRCEIELVKGDPERACAELARLAGGEENPHARLHAQRKLLQARARLGGAEHAQEVVRLVREAGAAAEAAGCANCAADLDLEAAEALARVGRRGEARARLGRAQARAGEHRALWRRWASALVAERAEASALLSAVVDDARRLGPRLDALWAGLDVAAVAAGADREGAAEVLRRVGSDADRIGSTTHAALARRELRRLGSARGGGARRARTPSASASARSHPSRPRGSPTRRSPAASSCRARRSSATSRPRSPSSAPATAPSSRPGLPRSSARGSPGLPPRDLPHDRSRRPRLASRSCTCIRSSARRWPRRSRASAPRRRPLNEGGQQMNANGALVTTDWVAANADGPGYRVVEVDEDTEAYRQGHIPGAIAWHWRDDLHGHPRRDFLDREGLAGLLGRSGVGPDTTVVLYGGNNNWFATYAYWLLRYRGFDRVTLMDGGRTKWELEGRELTAAEPAVTPADPGALGPQRAELRAFRDDALGHMAREDAAMIDVRSPAEFAGEVLAPPHLPQEQAQVPGHIPGAANVPWATAAREDGSFRSPDELARIYAGAGATPDRDVIAYCRIGERSSHTWFVLHEILGYPRVRNYDGSWTEYGSMVGVPVETAA